MSAARLWVGGLDCPTPSLSPHATMAQRTTVADPEERSTCRTEISHGAGLAGVGCTVRSRVEMTSDNHTHDRELQQDARAWAEFTGTKYTAALRQMGFPLAQGLFGERVSARHLIATLDEHAVIGARGGSPRLGENGFRSEATWRFDRETDFIELALITD